MRAVAWPSSTVKCEYIAEPESSFRMRRRHQEQGETVALTPKHMGLRGKGLYRAGMAAAVAVDHDYIRRAGSLLII